MAVVVGELILFPGETPSAGKCTSVGEKLARGSFSSVTFQL